MEGTLVAAGRFMVDKVAILVDLDEKLKAIIGIKGKMEKLKELSTTIDAVIEDVESRPLNDVAVTVKDLLRKMGFLARDLEDLVDYYDTDVLQKKQRSKAYFRPVRDFFSSNNQVVFKCEIGGMIKAITESLDSILLQKSVLLNLPQGNIRSSESNLRGELHSRTRFVVIGREAEKNQIVGMLTKDDKSHHDTVKVIAIVGMGGLGKTTLAQFVYNDQRVQDHFKTWRMWKVVGAEFDLTKIMKSVLQLATRKPVNISEIDLVMQELETALSGKKFLLVLDDVWNEDQEKWGVLKAVLTCGARGSKILVTTRSPEVSSIMGSFHTHQLQQLSEDDCLSLFRQFAFGEEAADQKLMEIGEKIVEKCGGVPLAAISLGCMLRGTRDEAYWSSVSNSEIWQLRDEEQKVLASLKLSYDTLPLQWKKCFAFGSLFAKNSTMIKDKLIKLWIANGFVRSEGEFDAETVGNHVLNQLVSRSFFLSAPFEDDPHETVPCCRMHDLMHDLARSVSGNAYWNCIEDSVEDIGKGTYHLQIVVGDKPNMAQVFGKKPLRLRTFLPIMFPYSFLFGIDLNLLEVFTKLKYLRALDLYSCHIREIPTSIAKLIHLRYLNLSDNIIEVLPDSMTLLPNLQYLNLGFNYQLRELPKKLVNMQNLRDLNLTMDPKLTHMPSGLSRLSNLRSLSVFVAGDTPGACSILELENLRLHGVMEIKFSENFKTHSCGGKKFLRNQDLNELHIEFNCHSESNDKSMLDDLSPNTSLKKLTISDYKSPQFPTWLIELQLPNLVEVCLERCRVYEHIPPFGNLLFLKKLHLCFMDGVTHLGAEFHGHGGFPSLRELVFGMENLEEWTDSDSVEQLLFPSLQSAGYTSVFRQQGRSAAGRYSDESEQQSVESEKRSAESVRVALAHKLACGQCNPGPGFAPPCAPTCEREPLPMHLFTTSMLVIHYKPTILPLNYQCGTKLLHMGVFSILQFLLFPFKFPTQSVWIFNCPKLKSMPRLPRIQELDISICSESLLSCIGRLTSLSVLKMSSMKDLASLPNGCIRNLTSLTELEISECRELQSLPGDEMQHLEKLRSLTIFGCNNLASFPLEMGCLSSLCFLRLRGCPSIIVRPEVLVQILNSARSK